jgi:uncharacterized protein YbbC (DUF1343 family)
LSLIRATYRTIGGRQRHPAALAGLALAVAVLVQCAPAGSLPQPSMRPAGVRAGEVLPGITVLLRDSVHLLAGKTFGLLTNQTGIDERGRSDIDLLRGDARVSASGGRLVSLFSPEHGIRGDLDRSNIASGRDERSGLPIHSLYGATTLAPPDSTLRDLDLLLFDLQDIGTRTWTYVGNLVYALRAVKRNNKQLVVLDRPNPLSGARADGPMLDSLLANPEEHRPERSARPYALWPFPLRHGMTMGEMALFYNSVLGIGADLRVVPMKGWNRTMWFDDTGLPWVKPSPNMPSLTSALIYPALVAFEASNMSVGRGTDDAFQRFGAPWLRAPETARLLQSLYVPGVRFEAETFTPREPSDRKYAGVRIPGVRIFVEDRERVHAGRLGAAILWAVDSLSGDSLRLNDLNFDLRFGSPAARAALRTGADHDGVIDGSLPQVFDFSRRAQRFFLYR